MQSESSPVRFGRGVKARNDVRAPVRRPAVARSRPWARLSWPLSLALFAVPAILFAASVLGPRFGAAPEVTLFVTDRYTGSPLATFEVLVDGAATVTDSTGTLTIPLDNERTEVTVTSPGYEGITAILTPQTPKEWTIALRPNVITGRLSDETTSTGVGGASVAIVWPDGAELTTTTANDGSFTFAGVPEGGVLRVSSADHGTVEEKIGQRTSFEFALAPSFVAGHVVDDAGNPIPNARVTAANGTAETLSAADGTFRLTGGTDVAEVLVSAPGYTEQTYAVDASRQVNAQLEAEMIKAIYANLGVLGDPERWNRLLEIADTTEINAIVVDVKQDTIYYDTQVPFFRDVPGMVTPVLDMESILDDMEERGIYSIARMVVFKDPVVAAGRPDLAVKDEVSGGLWLDMNGTPWVNAFEEELWAANADLGAELAQLGFDEVQYDYIRFPSDGDLRTADFGNDYSEEKRRAAISGAVALGAERVRAAGAHFAIDLFPIIALFGDDQGIGQTLQDLTPLADYVCLMIYPSHYELGNIPVDGHPNDFPAETVTYTLEQAEELVPGTMKKMRPWLQDFTYPLEGYSEYGPEDVRAQIDAAEAMGVSGWILWNAAGEFQVTALEPE